MTKQDFEMIAGVFSNLEAEYLCKAPPWRTSLTALSTAQRDLADEIEKRHPRFNRAKFDAACFPLAAKELRDRIVAQVNS